VTRDQPQPGSFLNKREEPGNEVVSKAANSSAKADLSVVALHTIHILHVEETRYALNRQTKAKISYASSVDFNNC
jgi:hypothetical protein